jgi:hypothetical protein
MAFGQNSSYVAYTTRYGLSYAGVCSYVCVCVTDGFLSLPSERMENMRRRIPIYMHVILCTRNIINKQLELGNNNNYWSGDVYFVIDVDWPFSAGSPSAVHTHVRACVRMRCTHSNAH